ncbi:uncharacterized protein [Panulirus ornatus]|uniref:uncharacterized protein n=1 Tax=Panulirus ornatus TaxID=150431 RepID=UPI003A87E0AE
MEALFEFLLVLLVSTMTAGHSCTDKDEISCGDKDTCIPLRYICDNDDDCDDEADEDHNLCQAWSNEECESGSTQCSRLGHTFCTDISSYCNLTDPPCEGDLDPRICQMLQDNVVQPINNIVVPENIDPTRDNLNESLHLAEELIVLLNKTIQHPQCPTMFTLVGDQCISLFFMGSVSWGEARAFCSVIGGDLLTFRNISHYAAVVRHLKDAQMTNDFWVGGRFLNQSTGWTWTDEAPMDLGSPFWAVRHSTNCRTRNVTFQELHKIRLANDGACYNYFQAPEPTPSGWCAALTYQHYFYVSDEDCLVRKSPLCVYTDDNMPVGQYLL